MALKLFKLAYGGFVHLMATLSSNAPLAAPAPGGGGGGPASVTLCLELEAVIAGHLASTMHKASEAPLQKAWATSLLFSNRLHHSVLSFSF